MYELNLVTEKPNFNYIKDLGINTNAMPVPFVEISRDDFMYHFFKDQIKYIEQKYICDKTFEGNITIFYFFNAAFGITRPTKWRCGGQNEPHIVYEDSPRYFKFGCEHEYGGELTVSEKASLVGRNLNPYKCKKCNIFFIQDSSG